MEALLHCELCPRRCRVNRVEGARGFCGGGQQVEVYRYAVHHGEEPPISGTRGSGTIFFSRCTMRCLYCQNYPWSQEGAGRAYTEEELAGALRALARAGCHNWNLVSPTPWLPMIRAALDSVRKDGFSLPVVYNTSGYERVETLEEYRDMVDIFLTDLRYAREDTARYASGAGDYVGIARRAFLQMWNQVGPLETTCDGVARRGVICRLLGLPGRAIEAVESLEWLARTVGTGVAVSIMAQYIPAYRAVGTPGWDRRITAEEFAEVRVAAEDLGFEQGWIQDTEGVPCDELVGFKMDEGAHA
ncbi:MAG: radical SAM protein [Kiritimatiellae bacterium]|nr:radical SAM protein [Kiritimatiellia bacterium]